MDKNQLATIAVTALISVTAKEFIAWLLAAVRTNAAKETTKIVAKKIVTRNNLWLAWACAAFCFSVFVFVRDIRSPLPVTRAAIAWIALGLVNVFVGAFFLSVILCMRIYDRK